MRRLVGIGVMCFSLLAQAQTMTPTAPTPPPISPPVVAAEEDRSVTFTEDEKILYGAERKELTPLELFGVLGRTDLLERSKENTERRKWLLISAIAVAAVGVGVGIAVLATGPNLENGRCNSDVTYYNSVCVPANTAHQAGGIAAIGGGLVIGGILASIAWWSRPEVFTRYELQKFIDQHNASLATGGKTPSSFKLEVTPAVSAAFAGLVARGTF
jgi:hypothetical protein